VSEIEEIIETLAEIHLPINPLDKLVKNYFTEM